MDNFIWPSDTDRAENGELNRVCEYLEEVLEDKYQLIKAIEIIQQDVHRKITERDALAAHVECLSDAGNALDKAFGTIMPGVAHISLQDYGVLNAGMDWQKARLQAPNTSLVHHDADVIASLKFPTMLRKMWSGGEVQQWLHEQAEEKRRQAT